MGSSTARTQLCAVGTTVITTGHQFLDHVLVIPDGVNAGSVTVYDNTAAGGREISFVLIPAASSVATLLNYSRPLSCDIGLTVVITGGSNQAIIGFGAA